MNGSFQASYFCELTHYLSNVPVGAVLSGLREFIFEAT
jgi:hypothetical protein